MRLMTDVGMSSIKTQSKNVPRLMRTTVLKCISMGTAER